MKFWEEIRLRRNQSRVMVTLKGRSRGEMGGNWHILPLVDVIGSRIEIRKWLGRYTEILVEEGGRTEGRVFQHREGDRINISNMDEGFHQGLRRVQLEEVGLIPEGVELVEDIEKRIDHRSI